MQKNCTLQLRLIFLLTSLIIFSFDFLQAQKIITVAGNSNGIGYGRKFYRTHECYGVATDQYGNIFFSEFSKTTVTLAKHFI